MSVVRCLLVVIILRLIEEEICGQLLVLVASKVGLNDQVTLEPETAKLQKVSLSTLNG